MKIGIRRVAELGIALTAVTTLILAGCGGGSSSSSGGGGTPGVGLATALSPVLQTGNVVTAQFQRRDQSSISNVAVAYDLNTTNAPGFNDAQVRVSTGTIATGATNYSTALPAGTFNMRLGNPGFATLAVGGLNAVAGTAAVSAVNAVVGNYSPEIIPVTVTNATVTNYRAEEYQWTINTPAASAVQVTVIQVDASGKPDYGTGKVVASILGAGNSYWTTDSRIPYVVAAASSVITGGVTTVQLNTELLPGSYKAYVTATNASGVPVAATYVSPSVITSTATSAGTGTPQNVPITLAAGKAVSLTLNNNAAAAIPNRLVDFFDGTTWFPLGRAITDATGTASIAVDSATTTVAALVYSGPTAAIADAVYTFSNIGAGGATATLKQQTVTGAVQPDTTCALTPVAGAATIGTIKVTTGNSAGLPVIMNDLPIAASATVATNGAYSLTLFGPATGTGITYNLAANGTTAGSPGVDGCADVTVTPTTVANVAVTQNLVAAGGGTVVGKISTKAGAAVSGMTIDLWQSTASGNKRIATTTTNASGNYQIAVPYGTYTLWAGSSIVPLAGWAATEGVVVSAAAPQVTKNLTKFTLTMQVAKSIGTSQSASTSPTVNAGGLSVAASNLGVASVDIMEGKTWLCARPGATEASYSYLCNLNVLVDLAAVTAAGQ